MRLGPVSEDHRDLRGKQRGWGQILQGPVDCIKEFVFSVCFSF